MSEEKAEYMKTYTSFSGADMMPVLNGDAIGEVQEVRFEEDLTSVFGEVTGYVDVCVFDRDTFRQKIKKIGDEFILVAANEYGQSMGIEFEHIQFTKRFGGVSVDDVIMVERYLFTASRVTYHQGLRPSDVISHLKMMEMERKAKEEAVAEDVKEEICAEEPCTEEEATNE